MHHHLNESPSLSVNLATWNPLLICDLKASFAPAPRPFRATRKMMHVPRSTRSNPKFPQFSAASSMKPFRFGQRFFFYVQEARLLSASLATLSFRLIEGFSVSPTSIDHLWS